MKPLRGKTTVRRASRPSFEPLSAHETELADFFVQMAGILGVPRSVAEIYSLLYAAAAPLDFDQIQGRLGMSKGSVSQGLKFLRDQGMILSVKTSGSRLERWRPTPSLAASLASLLRNRVLPAFEQASPVLQRACAGAEQSGATPEVLERLSRLRRWNSRALELLPLLLPPPADS